MMDEAGSSSSTRVDVQCQSCPETVTLTDVSKLVQKHIKPGESL